MVALGGLPERPGVYDVAGFDGLSFVQGDEMAIQ